jgi:ubiquinone/menaquinone biosynthesis C-methylase UbiE
MLRKLYYLLPPAARFWARRIVYWPLDIADWVQGKRNPMVPPRGMIFTGSGDFKEQGRKMAQLLLREAGLQAHHQVLDVGSGIGRMDVALTDILSSQGRFVGFDVVKKGIRWSQKHISSRYPNFQFTHIDLGNDLYKSSRNNAADFTFPYKDGQFDCVTVISVFTHMLPEEVQRYLEEIQRVMKPGGRCLATFFLLNDTSRSLMQHQTHFHFPYDHGHYRLMSERVKSANVAFEEDYLQKSATKAGLRVEKYLPGYWCGRKKKECEDFQDVLVLVRE